MDTDKAKSGKLATGKSLKSPSGLKSVKSTIGKAFGASKQVDLVSKRYIFYLLNQNKLHLYDYHEKMYLCYISVQVEFRFASFYFVLTAVPN